jgi:hypothetical protein
MVIFHFKVITYSLVEFTKKALTYFNRSDFRADAFLTSIGALEVSYISIDVV